MDFLTNVFLVCSFIAFYFMFMFSPTILVVVDIRPGGNTVIGTDALAKSPPDGHTILATVVTNHVINSLLIPNLPFDSVKDFAPVATVSSTDYVLVLHPSVPARNLKEFIALAKSKPGGINFASSGVGGSPHLCGELFNTMAELSMTHVPYKGGAFAAQELMGGRIDLMFDNMTAARRYVETGRKRGNLVLTL